MTDRPAGADTDLVDADRATAAWVGAERADHLRAASVDWPSWDLLPAQVDDLELVLDGLLDPEPLTVPVAAATDWRVGDTVALRDPEGTMMAALRIDRRRAVDDATIALEGGCEGVARPARWSFRALRHTPEQLRARFADDETVLAVVTDRALHRDDVEEIRTEVADRRGQLLLVQLEVADAGADATAAVTRALLAALPELRVATTLSLLPCSPRLLTDTSDARRDAIARALGAGTRLRLGRIGTDVEAAIRRGDSVANDATFPAVEAELRAAHPPRHDRGLVVLFTGLSGSGKSTVANALRGRLLERGDRRVTLLDGDLVRKHLSAGLGFSREDRATNVRRIGYVAAQIAHHGGIAICAPIAPDAGVRADVAAMAAQADAGFVLVHVATPLEVCEQRDRKGLYAKARAGALTGFTGIDDPYDAPEQPDLRLDTVDADPQACAQQVLDLLVTEGWLTGDR
ncbi:adenylyl-sulfate kinase [Egicoccus sp. AB-alg6-2]|uniref:adenylyl-sulfate kinase n=1 Tax=Egicoccus sp. AB-alg6-2 TaxID=3242692 RepID=UPI00359E60C3